MKRIFLVLLFIASPAFADWNGNCIVGDHYSENKTLHSVGNFLVVSATTALTNDPLAGAMAGVAVSAAREAYKIGHPAMRCEYASIAYDLVGISLGYWVGKNWIVTPRPNGLAVSYSVVF